MKLRHFLAAPFDAIANLIDPPPPPTFWQRLTQDPDLANTLQHLIQTAHTTWASIYNLNATAKEGARTTHLTEHVVALGERLDKMEAERLVKEGIKDPLPRPGEVLGDYIARLAAARIGGLLWVWDDGLKRWAALDHHVPINAWVPEPNVGEEAADVLRQAAGRPPASPAPSAEK